MIWQIPIVTGSLLTHSLESIAHTHRNNVRSTSKSDWRGYIYIYIDLLYIYIKTTDITITFYASFQNNAKIVHFLWQRVRGVTYKGNIISINMINKFLIFKHFSPWGYIFPLFLYTLWSYQICLQPQKDIDFIGQPYLGRMGWSLLFCFFVLKIK